MSIVNKTIKLQMCFKCNGKGCEYCHFTGFYEENYCYYIDDKNGIAIDGEPGQ